MFQLKRLTWKLQLLKQIESTTRLTATKTKDNKIFTIFLFENFLYLESVLLLQHQKDKTASSHPPTFSHIKVVKCELPNTQVQTWHTWYWEIAGTGCCTMDIQQYRKYSGNVNNCGANVTWRKYFQYSICLTMMIMRSCFLDGLLNRVVIDNTVSHTALSTFSVLCQSFFPHQTLNFLLVVISKRSWVRHLQQCCNVRSFDNTKPHSMIWGASESILEIWDFCAVFTLTVNAVFPQNYPFPISLSCFCYIF